MVENIITEEMKLYAFIIFERLIIFHYPPLLVKHGVY